MRFSTPKKCLRTCLAIAAAAALAGAISAPVWAGGSSFGDGYKQAKTLRRKAAANASVPIVETECTLQKS